MLSGDFPRTAEIALTTGEEGLRKVDFELFRPILPMLASTAETVAEAVASFERASVEWKLDGIRVQIHRRGDDVRI
jgi:DNA ligase-1